MFELSEKVFNTIYTYESTVDIMNDIEWVLQELGEFKGKIKVTIQHDESGEMDDDEG